MMGAQRTYAVGTFYHPEYGKDPFAKRTVAAYTRYYNPDWEGCIVFSITAASGNEAKRDAVKRRLDYERIREEIESCQS